MGVEPTTSSMPRKRSPSELQPHFELPEHYTTKSRPMQHGFRQKAEDSCDNVDSDPLEICGDE